MASSLLRHLPEPLHGDCPRVGAWQALRAMADRPSHGDRGSHGVGGSASTPGHAEEAGEDVDQDVDGLFLFVGRWKTIRPTWNWKIRGR